jgi:ClpA/ClpB-like protein
MNESPKSGPWMGDYRSHLRELDRLAHLAWQEARRLRCTVIGPEQFVLAILHAEASDSVAARALRECGITREGFEEVTRRQQSEDEIPGGPQLNPAGMQVEHMAEGIATGLGAGEVRAEHVLLAYLWAPSHSAWELEQLGTSREQVRNRLASLGVDLPQRDLPTRDPRRYGPSVDVSLDELWILLRQLSYVLPQDASFAWNHDWKKGWISVTEGLEAKDWVARALERHRRINLPPETVAD